jgi:hypothetical protein
MVERFDLESLVAVRAFLAHAFTRGERDDFVGWEFALSQNVEHFAPDIAGSAYDGDLVTHC